MDDNRMVRQIGRQQTGPNCTNRSDTTQMNDNRMERQIGRRVSLMFAYESQNNQTETRVNFKNSRSTEPKHKQNKNKVNSEDSRSAFFTQAHCRIRAKQVRGPSPNKINQAAFATFAGTLSTGYLCGWWGGWVRVCLDIQWCQGG